MLYSGFLYDGVCRCALFVLLSGVLLMPAAAQTVLLHTQPDGTTQETTFPDGAFLATVATPDSLITVSAFDPNEEVDVIVQFASPPFSVVSQAPAKAAALATAQAAMTRERQQFLDALATLDAASKQSALAPGGLRTRFDYRTALNGMAVSTRRWVVAHMASLPSVRGVYPDVAVHTLDEDSNHLIGADSVHANLGITGEGVTVAIIDTGIDYTHPDLGGGFGPGYKVTGGYDLIADDPDPKDEHGHGTHVAGIVAADGTTHRGVAPDAHLMAFRVLDASGNGSSSTIIAGIERALDPDGNPATPDHVDVINLSLGGTGSPEHPMAQAVDNAVGQGVVCVAAAGNIRVYQGILAPGTATRAITVGASDDMDHSASFTAQGPTSLAFTNKPDLLAPGVDISAPVPGATYRTLSGTSMAAPHVAGAAALLLERQPGWTPAMVKAALVQSAVPLTQEDLWTQGSGRLDVLAATRRHTLAAPSTISLGFIDHGRSTATHTETLTLYNVSDQAQTFTFAFEDTPPGVTPRVDPASITVPPGGQGTVTFTADIQTQAVPFAALFPPSLVGHLVAHSAAESIVIPYSLLKAPHLEFRYSDYAPAFLMVHDGEQRVALFKPDQLFGAEAMVLPLPAGTYDVIAVFLEPDPRPGLALLAFDIREEVKVSTKTKLGLSWKQGENLMLFALRDRDAAPLTSDFSFTNVVFDEGRLTMQIQQPIPFDRLRVSDVSDRYRVDVSFHTFSHPSGADYMIPFSIGPGVSDDARLQNDPAAFKRVETTFDVTPDVQHLVFAPSIYNSPPIRAPQRFSYYSIPLIDLFSISPPFKRTVYYGPQASGHAFRFHSQLIFDTTLHGVPILSGPDANLWLESPLLEITPDEILGYRSGVASQPLFRSTAPVYTERAGASPPWWAGRFNNRAHLIEIVKGDFSPLFANPDGDFTTGIVRTDAMVEGARVYENLSSNENSLARPSLSRPVLGSPYEMTFSFTNYAVHGLPGRATTRVRFQVDADPLLDPNPPALAALRLTSDGSLSNAFLPGAENTIQFTAQDVGLARAIGSVASAELFYRRWGVETTWQALPLSRTSDTFTAAWPEEVADGFYALRILATDEAGHTLDYVADPALRFGSANANTAPTPPALHHPADQTTIALDTLAHPVRFAWDASDDADDDSLYYIVTFTGPAYDTTLVVSEPEVDLPLAGRLHEASTYTWHVQATDGFSVAPAQHTFTLHTTAVAVARDEAPEVPQAVALRANYPNPFSTSTTIEYALPSSGAVRLDVFDVLGRRLAVLVDARLPAGTHRAVWHTGSVPSGVYLYRLSVDDQTYTRRMMLMR